MISTALKIAEEARSVLSEDEILSSAVMLYRNRDESADNFKTMLFNYTAIVSAITANKIAKALLSEKEFDQLLDAIGEFDEMEKSVMKDKNNE